MTDTELALRDRFRSTLAGRARILSEQLPAAATQPLGSPVRREILGELHTLKGEAKMLGHTTLARLCHVLEEHLRGATPDVEALGAVLDAILLSLAPDASADSAEDLLRMALMALDAEALPDQEAGPQPGADEAGRAPIPVRSPVTSEAAAGSWVQVNTRSIDDLTETLSKLSAELAALGPVLTGWVAERSTLERTDARARAESLRTLVSEALLVVTDLRLTSLDQLFSRLAAHGRVLGKERGKVVDVGVSTQGVRVERDVADRLFEPLLHLVNNAVDHGLEAPEERGDKGETGRLSLRARSEGSSVVVEVADDGRGIDPERVNRRARELGRTLQYGESPLELIFEAGFSTRTTADDVSGRGVGLDVVKRRIETLGGSVTVESQLGSGVKFCLRLPAAVTQERLLVVRSGSTLFGLSDRLVVSVHSRSETESARTLLRSGEEIPMRSLSELLGTQRHGPESAIFVVEFAGLSTAIACEEIRGHLEVILRPTSPRLAQVCGVSSSALTDNGELVLVLAPHRLKASLRAAPGAPTRSLAADAASALRQRVLVVDDSVIVRDLLTEILTSAGYQVRGAKNGKEALAELADFDPHAVLSDIEMPEMDGFRLLEAIRTRSAKLPVVLVTARRSDEDHRRAEALGANAYLEKGRFQSRSVLDTVKLLLGDTP